MRYPSQFLYLIVQLIPSFELFVPLHHLWIGYMSELLALITTEPPSSTSIHSKLLKADFSGSFISVQKSKNPSLVAIQGIVIHESENTFVIITKDNTTKGVATCPTLSALICIFIQSFQNKIQSSLYASQPFLPLLLQLPPPFLKFRTWSSRFMGTSFDFTLQNVPGESSNIKRA